MKLDLSVFYGLCFWLLSKNSLCKPCSQRFCSRMVSPQSFISFTLTSMVHFDSFLYVVQSMGASLLFVYDYLVVQHHLLNNEITFAPLLTMSWPCICGLFLDFILSICMSVLSPIPHCLDYHSFIVKSWNQCGSSKIVLIILVPLHFHIHFGTSLLHR